MGDFTSVDQHIRELQQELERHIEAVWAKEEFGRLSREDFPYPGWLVLRDVDHAFHPNLVKILEELKRHFGAEAFSTMASDMYFNPHHWRELPTKWFVPDNRQAWMKAYQLSILNAALVDAPPHDLHARIETRLRRMFQNPYENTEIPRGGEIAYPPRYYLPPTVEDCLRLLIGLPPSPENVAFIERVLMGDLDKASVEVPTAFYNLQSAESAYKLYYLYTQFHELLVYLFAHDRLTYDTFRACVVHLPLVQRHLDRHSIPVLTLCNKQAYRQRIDEYRDRLIEEVAQNMTADNFAVLLHSDTLPRGAPYLLKAAEYHVKFNPGKLKLTDYVKGYNMLSETIENAIVHLARATSIPRASDVEGQAVVAQLREFPEATLQALLPVTGARRLVCEALGWQSVIPFIDWMSTVSGGRDVPNSDDPTVGVVDIEAVRAAFAEAGEERVKHVLKLFREANAGMSNTIMLLEAVAGWNRAEVEKRFQKQTQIAIKAYGLLPLERGEAEVLERYLALRESAREGRKFGAGRRASHTAAVEVALANLAQVAGYADASRLEWEMESKIAQEVAPSGKTWTAGEYEIRLTARGTEVDLSLTKAGKVLKSVPKAVRASEAYQEAKEAAAQLRLQASRLRSGLIEGLIATGDALTPDDLAQLIRLPAARALLEALILRDENGTFGIFTADSLTLRDLDGRQHPIASPVILAHPYHLFQEEVLAAWQRNIIHHRIVQPVKQAFRELYVLTPAEQTTGTYSNRFAGHLVDGRVAGRLLTTRGWRTQDHGYEGVLAYKRFPTMRAVFAFTSNGHYLSEPGATVTTDRIYFEPQPPHQKRRGSPPDGWLPLEQVPPLIFSEVMRDADLVVSVGQRQGEVLLSNEAYQQRGSLVKALLDDLGLPGVTIDGHFAYVTGKLAKYRVHLGSAVIHIEPGNYLCIVPQRWGQTHEQLFLPFADQNDAKTSEVISKILLLAADDQIKDESILRQIKREV